MKPVVYLDRDGVINENRSDYVKTPSEWVPIPGAIAAMTQIQKAGFRIIIVTNQSGIGRGFYTKDNVETIHQVMLNAFKAAGLRDIKILYCPHHPDDGCNCRKPETGMIELARKKYRLPLDGWMVGDADSDMELGRRAGLKTILVLTGRGKDQLDKIKKESLKKPDYVCSSLLSSLDIILTP